MACYILLKVDNNDEARQLIEDMRDYPDSPILSPVQENRVHVSLDGCAGDLKTLLAMYPDEDPS